jgi:hypothetical protein
MPKVTSTQHVGATAAKGISPFGNSRGYADIPVTQTSQYRNGNEFALARDFWRLWVRNRRVTLQALVGPGQVIILFDILPK